MQLRFVTLLDAQFADVVGATVIARIFGFFDLGFFGRVDAPDVANHMAGQLAVGIVAKQPRLDFHTGKAVALRGKSRHLFVGQAVANGHRLKALGFIHLFFKAASVARLNLYHRAQLLNHIFQRLHDFGGRDLQGVGRVVGRQNDAVAIHDDATVRDDGHDGRAVVFGFFVELVVANHLQIKQAQSQHQKRTQDGKRHHHGAASETPQIALNVANHTHSGRVSSGSGARRCGANKITLTMGHNKASNKGAKMMDQPGKEAPDIMRMTNSRA